ncbi:MAG TPA: amino acid adenylation domain-containing protein [Acidimicrobiales bacterium]|nr:amino acid adenylation domain-containing protein [Acidimicrobiales bacterium]
MTDAELPEADRRRVLVEWNDTAAPFPRTIGVHHMVEAQADRTPGAVAVLGSGRSLTYAELDAAANRWAHHLASLGVGPGVVVGLCLSRTVDMVVALLAVLKAGGAYLPLDPEYPAERLRFMLEDSATTAVICEEALLDRLPAIGGHVVCIDRDRPVADALPADRPHVPFDQEQVAYLIYTSGSTGRPKGVQVPHRGMVNLLTVMLDRPGLRTSDVVAAVTTLSFDIAGVEVWLPLTVGARVVVVPAEVAAAPGPLMDLLDGAGATVFQATPATFRMLLEAGWQGRPGLKVLCGGEAMPVSLAAALLERDVELWNMYGPTETTVWSLTARVTRPRQALSIGRPLGNNTVYVLDPSLRPVPVGVPGELHIGGAGVAHGYLGRPGLTAERFVPHPFDDTPGARVYKTGDLVRWSDDGSVEFLGRLDHQVKVRGFRVELGEVEAALESQPGVRAAVVAAGADAQGTTRLVAYVVPGADPPTTTELRHRLQLTLPAYMVPSLFVTLDAFPLTPNGKVDRKALPPPTATRPELLSAFVPPRTPAERTLAAVWGEVLGVDGVGIEDDFFELGGQSLLALRVVAEVRRSFDVDLRPGAVYEAPTVAELAARVLAEADRAEAPALVALDRSTFIR